MQDIPGSQYQSTCRELRACLQMQGKRKARLKLIPFVGHSTHLRQFKSFNSPAVLHAERSEKFQNEKGGVSI